MLYPQRGMPQTAARKAPQTFTGLSSLRFLHNPGVIPDGLEVAPEWI